MTDIDAAITVFRSPYLEDIIVSYVKMYTWSLYSSGQRLACEVERLKNELEWISRTNAMDYEYRARATRALASLNKGEE